MNIDPSDIASATNALMAQRLVRKLCDKCKQTYKPDPDLLKRVGIKPTEAEHITFYKAVGCDECFNTGYKGRLVIFEVMEVTDKMSHLIVERANASVIKKLALEEGMHTLGMDGLRYIKAGKTTIEEVLSVAHVEEAVEDMELKKCNLK